MKNKKKKKKKTRRTLLKKISRPPNIIRLQIEIRTLVSIARSQQFWS